jgi:hypothetical protein
MVNSSTALIFRSMGKGLMESEQFRSFINTTQRDPRRNDEVRTVCYRNRQADSRLSVGVVDGWWANAMQLKWEARRRLISSLHRSFPEEVQLNNFLQSSLVFTQLLLPVSRIQFLMSPMSRNCFRGSHSRSGDAIDSAMTAGFNFTPASPSRENT